MSAAEFALVVLVPESEALVRPFRDRHDPSAAAGMPAHITLLYPFMPPDAIDARVLDGLRQCFGGFAPFSFTLTAPRRFDSPSAVLYLAPEPELSFRALTMAIWRRYPKTPPYGGRHADVVPHLSVAQLADQRQLDLVAQTFAAASAKMLPMHAQASEVALMDNHTSRWETRAMLVLGSS